LLRLVVVAFDWGLFALSSLVVGVKWIGFKDVCIVSGGLVGGEGERGCIWLILRNTMGVKWIGFCLF